MRRHLLFLAALAAGGVLSACTSQESFPDAAQRFIQDDDGEVAQTTGLTYEDAMCTDPGTKDVGTEFACTAVGSDGMTYNFVGRITGRQTFEVGLGSPPVAAPSGTSVPASAPTSTPAASAPAASAPAATAAATSAPATGG